MKKRDRIAKRFCLPTRGGEKPARRLQHREIIIEQANCHTVFISRGIQIALLVNQESIVNRKMSLSSMKAAGCSMGLTNRRCDGLARQRSENVWGSPMTSTKLSSHSSRNAKPRPNSKRNYQVPTSLKGGSATDRRFQFHKRSQLFLPLHNGTLAVAAVRVNNPNRSAFRINY